MQRMHVKSVCHISVQQIVDPDSVKIQQGVYLLKPGSKQPYKQKKDGSIVDSKGKAVSPGAVTINVFIFCLCDMY